MKHVVNTTPAKRHNELCHTAGRPSIIALLTAKKNTTNWPTRIFSNFAGIVSYQFCKIHSECPSSTSQSYKYRHVIQKLKRTAEYNSGRKPTNHRQPRTHVRNFVIGFLQTDGFRQPVGQRLTLPQQPSIKTCNRVEHIHLHSLNFQRPSQYPT